MDPPDQLSVLTIRCLPRVTERQAQELSIKVRDKSPSYSPRGRHRPPFLCPFTGPGPPLATVAPSPRCWPRACEPTPRTTRPWARPLGGRPAVDVEADVEGADLTGTDLTGADLRSVHGLSAAQVRREARTDATTRF
ncbi:pentapeptide repeat-containing protein [Actinomadura sp. DC4]|uniref:pentapeptide repeat-containing protein n=1 Tax=Actinomadura sp. DC4 TaxID=3055069 RepID=UPI00339D34B0